MLKAIKIQIYPTDIQQDYISRLLGSCRFVFNNCLAHKINVYNETKETVGYAALGKYLTNLKQQEETNWLKEIHSHPLSTELINIETAYKRFFKNGAGFPSFKKKGQKESCHFHTPSRKSIRGNRLTIIKQLKNILFKCSIKDEKYLNKHQKDIRSGTLSRTKSGKYFYSILIDREHDKVLPETDNVIGLDLGIKDFIVTSDNKKYPNLRLLEKNKLKLLRLNRQFSKKQKGSKNRDKARVKIARIHEKINNQKDYYLHSVVNELLDENQVIVIEDLSIEKMVKSVEIKKEDYDKLSKEKQKIYSKKKSDKKSISKGLSEVSLSEFNRILKYKAEWYGRDIIEIDRYYPSSKLCYDCGYKNDDLQLEDRVWRCHECNEWHDRDYNAAKNILKEGKRILNIK